LLALSLTYIYPFLFMLSTALRPQQEYVNNPLGLPRSVTFEHVASAWQTANLGQAIRNSLLSVSIGVVLCCVICSTAAFYFVRHKSRISAILLGTFGSLWIIPPVVWIIPFFILLASVNLTNDLVVLGIVYGTVYSPAFIWLMWAYFLQGLPDDILEAAELDGASQWQQYRYIALPLSMPALGTVAALTFIYAWGDLLFAVVLLQTPDRLTVVPAAATLVGRFDASIQEATAAAALTLLPSLLVFLVAQRAIVRGITAGFQKG
jgi:ABC-type glycerol-3-phosphate transport system permease component